MGCFTQARAFLGYVFKVTVICMQLSSISFHAEKLKVIAEFPFRLLSGAHLTFLMISVRKEMGRGGGGI